MLQFAVDNCLYGGRALNFFVSRLESVLKVLGTADGEEEATGVGE